MSAAGCSDSARQPPVPPPRDPPAPTAPGFRRVVVVGGGLVGGSVAAAIRRHHPGTHVTVVDTSASVRARVLQRGLADAVEVSLPVAVADADLVIAATPAAGVPTVLVEAARHAGTSTVLTDVASLKAPVILDVESQLRALGRAPSQFLGGHPMAGSEHSGPDAADPALFQGATWVLTPTPSSSDEVLGRLASFLRAIGARVLVLPAPRHDELVALVSHLPQLVSSVLADVADDAVRTTGEAVLALAGGGFRDTTRIAASDPQLWLGILQGNREAVLDAVEAYEQRLAWLRDALQAQAWDDVTTLLSRASRARRQLVDKGVRGPAVDLVVPLDDRPGGLAAATTALGEAGINVEDVAMRHAVDSPRGAVLLRIAASDAERGVAALDTRGLAAHIEDVDPGAGSHA